VPGLAIMTLWFLLWVSLLQSYDLSYLFPFDSLSTVLLSLGAMVFLKEKLTARLWVGIALIIVGVMFVSAS
jgi:undecaprenyl phosphate-alpha-L-ara4N flippase subunit ArnE